MKFYIFFPYGNALPLLECLSLVFKDRCSQNKNQHLHPMTYQDAFSSKARDPLSHTLNPIVKHGGDETRREPTLVLQALLGYADLIQRIQASNLHSLLSGGPLVWCITGNGTGLVCLPARSNIRHTAKKSGYSARPV